MKKYIALGLITIVLVAGVVYFSRTTASPPVDPRLIEADNDFAFRLFKEVAKKDGDRNIFISPISIVLALQMTYNGASGNTRDEIAKVLGIEDLTPNELNKANGRLSSTLRHLGRKAKLDIAHSIWTGKAVKPSFQKVVGSSYSVEFGPLNAEAMNTWANKRTKGRIKSIVKQLDSNNPVVLLNAACFDADWESKFEEKGTKFLPFTNGHGVWDEVPTMGQSHEFACMEEDGCKGIKIPYRGGRLSMYIFLPDHSLKEFIDKMSIGDWYRWMTAFGEPREIGVYLPRFKFAYQDSLKAYLAALGMSQAFDGEDFVNMVEGGGAWIGRMDHKTMVEVNEDGTKAAAVTPAIFESGMDFTYFMVNRPFFFVIRDDKTGLILFMGSVVDPTKS